MNSHRKSSSGKSSKSRLLAKQTTTGSRPHRVLLVLTARTYRGEAFQRAAAKLNIELIPIVDMAQELANHWRFPLGVDFDRPDQAVDTVAAYANTYPVHAVLAVDDAGTLLAARIAARLHLPHNDPVAALATRDKFLMRTRMSAAGAACPGFQRIAFATDPSTIAAGITYPCVIKPLNLNGSRGVIRADNPQQFVRNVDALQQILSREPAGAEREHYLVEDFIPGHEVALEGMLDNGELTVLALFDKPDPLDGPYFEETIYVTPSRHPAGVQAAIAGCATVAARALGLRQGPVHAELRVNEQGPWMLEIAGRSIGGLCSQTLRFDLDTSLEELILRQACGLPMPSMQREQCASGVMMIPIPAAGILKHVHGIDEALAVPHIEDIEITARLNYPILPLPAGDSYLGFIFARAQTPAAVEAALRQAHEHLTFAIVPEFSLQLS